jgi:hypothetical protein
MTPSPAPLVADRLVDAQRPAAPAAAAALRPTAVDEAVATAPAIRAHFLDPLDTVELTAVISAILADEARRHGIEV